MPASSILLLDAEPASAEAISTTLSSVGYTVTVTADPDDAIARAADHQLVIVDVVTGPMSAVEVCQAMRATPAMTEVPILCVSQTDDVDERIAFLEAGADDVIAKPFDAPRARGAGSRRCCSASSARADMGPIYSADGLTMARAAAHGRGLQPEGRRRDDDHRHQHRGVRRRCAGPTRSSSSTSPSSSAASPATST